MFSFIILTFALDKANIFMAILFDIPINKPFDPSSLKVEVKNTTVGQLADMLKNGMIDMQPDFQRHGDLWSNGKKSRLIESIILGLPIPSFYFYIDTNKEQWVVIDGLQRLCSINDFMVEKTLKLTALQLLGKTHNKRSFEDFSYFEQLEMSMRSVTLNVISGASSAEAKYIIFQRINSEGTKLSPAEIRNALFHGRSMELVKKLAESSEFEDATNGRVSKKRLLHYDYVSRFFAFYIQGYKDYMGNKMDFFIGNALERMNNYNGEEDWKNVEKAFFDSLYLCKSLLGDGAFQQPLNETDRKNLDVKSNPISISLFEAMMWSVSHLSDIERQELLKKKSVYIVKYAEMFNDEFLRKELSNGTNQYKSVNYRFNVMERLVNDVLK